MIPAAMTLSLSSQSKVAGYPVCASSCVGAPIEPMVATDAAEIGSEVAWPTGGRRFSLLANHLPDRIPSVCQPADYVLSSNNVETFCLSVQMPSCVVSSCVFDASDALKANVSFYNSIADRYCKFGDVASNLHCFCRELSPTNCFDTYTRDFVSSVNQSLHSEIKQIERVRALASSNSSEKVPELQRSAPKIKKAKKAPRLAVETYNGNCWSRIQAHLRDTKNNVLFCQEHKLMGGEIDEARLWCKLNGWTSYWAEASGSPGDRKSRSGGVVILVRAYIQSWVPTECDSVLFAHRAVAAVVSAGSLRPLLCISCYFHVNNSCKTKATPPNLRMLSVLGSHIMGQTLPALIGADWNMEPAVLKGTGVLGACQLEIRHTDRIGFKSVGTCVTNGGACVSDVDYFVCSKHVNDVVDYCYTCMKTAPRPHRPVGLVFNTRPRSFLVEVLKEPPKLSVAPPFGPPPPPTDWSVFEDEILGSDFHSFGFGSGNEYQVFDCVRKREAMCVLENSLGKWLNAASVDLPR